VGLYLFLFFVARLAWRELRAPPSDSQVTIDLVMIDPARSRWQAGRRAQVQPGASLGREEGNTIVIDEDTISAQHALFHYERGRWWIEDLGSTNGTFINGRPVTGRQPVAAGDEVRFGTVAMSFGAAPVRSQRR
jgi:pSer/pThr/pTyr-binding forkhead associated (FHA) protein